ncbi:MAG: hypothetical protein MRY74_12555 [Neomegalonema sp.]|nr:hypothetical protein [Neomegalonema sp.]
MAEKRSGARRGAWLILPPVLLGIGVLYFARSNPPTPTREPAAEYAQSVRVVKAVSAPFAPRAVGYGPAKPARSWIVSSDVAGRVVFVSDNFVRGGVVRAGETLLKIDDADYRLAADRARADIVSIDAQIDELKLNRDNLKAALAVQKQSLKVAERELKRQKDLQARSAGTAVSVDQKERDALARKAAVLDLENQIKLVPAKIRALESSKAVKKAQLGQAELDLKRVVIKAPFAGRVAETAVAISQFVTVGGKLGVVDGVEAAEINAQFPVASLRDFGRLASRRKLAEAAPGVGRIDRLGEQFGVWAKATLEAGVSGLSGGAAPSWQATVLRISEEVDEKTRAVGVIVSVPNPYKTARPGKRPALIKGAFLKVELFGAPVDGLVLAPRASLRVNAVGDVEILVVGADERLERRKVVLVASMDDVAAIGAGIKAGERIVVTDLAPAIVGQKMRAVLDAAATARLAAAIKPPVRPAAAKKSADK